MSKRLAFLVVLFALALSPVSQLQTRVAVPTAVAVRAASGEDVSIIVGVDATFVPEGNLDQAAVAEQRDAIARVTDDVMARVASAGVVVGSRLDFLPFFTARVNSATLEALSTTSGVKSIEINGLDRATLASSVPITNAPPAWAAGFTGTGWTVAIIDTGVDKTHSFLTGKVGHEACYVNAGGAGEGTSTCPGGGFASVAVGSGVPCSVTDDCAHGTHVAGIAAGANGENGVNGVAPGANLVALQVFTRFDDTDNCGLGQAPCALAYNSDQVLALNRAAALAGAGNVNHIASVNMSLGGGQYFDQATCDGANVSNGRKAAIDNLRSLGVAVVAASGNNSYATSMSAPGCISSAISVGSINDNLSVSSFSNSAPFLSLYAPGSSVRSSVPGNGYADLSGTSMATPHVAGAWAILKQVTSTASVGQVLGALQSSNTSIADQRGGLGSGHPLINVNAARLLLQSGASGVPGAPMNFTSQVNGSALALSWGPPTVGGAPTGYTLVVRLASGGPVFTTLPLGNVNSMSTTAPNGTFYLSVVASNSSGSGPQSAVVPAVVPSLPTRPGSPTNLSVSVAGSTATFTWAAPPSGGPVGEYVLAAGVTPGFTTAVASIALPGTSTAVVIPGIPAGVFYVRVYARNAGGNSPFSSNEVTVTVAGPTAPGTPVLNTPTVSGGVVGLSWSPGAGGAPTSYTLYASVSPGGAPIATVPLTGTSVAVPGVPSGTYYLRLTASNALGTSGFSNQVTVVVP